MAGAVQGESPFARAARELVDLGYSPIPIIPPGQPHGGSGKAPGEFRSGVWRGLSQWERFRDRQPTPFEIGLWLRWPDTNCGLVAGTRIGPNHLIAVDVDSVEHYDTIVQSLPHTPMRKRGAKGETRFYQAPPSIKTRAYDGPGRARLVDLLTGFETRQTVVPPSVHPTGATYAWLAGPVSAADLPIFGADDLEKLEDTLRALGWDAQPQRPARDPAEPLPEADDFWSEVKAAALANLDAWVPALELYGLRRARQGFECVATWRESCTGRANHERKKNLSIQPGGIKDWGTNDTYSAIDLVMTAQGIGQAEATDWLRERLGLKNESVVIELRPRQQEAAPEPEPAPSASPAPSTDELPDALTRIPGLLGEIVDWICDSARRPQRGLALGAALCLVGTAAGRKYAGPTRTGTHLYALGLARTSAGKDHPLQCIARILTACQMQQHIGPSQFMSLSAVVNRLTRTPLTLSGMDEFGSFVARINNRRASTHEQAITGILRTAWSSSFQTMSPPEWAGRSSEPIHAPALSIYGVSTPEEFYAALAGADVHNGFLNRFMLLSTKLRPREREPRADPFQVPTSIKDGMQRVYGSGSALITATAHNGQADGPAISATWDNDAARKVYADFGRSLEDRESDMAFLARTAEIAQRLATIRAIGIRADAPRITVADIEWGRDVALWSAERMMAETSDHIAETQNQADAQRIIRILRNKGRTRHRDLLRCLQHRMKSRDLKDVIDQLRDSGTVTMDTERPPGGGAETRWYRLA